MLEQLRQCRGVLLLIAMLVMVIRVGGLHAHVDVPASLEQGFGAQEHFNTSVFDTGDHHHDHEQEDSGHADRQAVDASNRHSAWTGFDFNAPIIVGVIALALLTLERSCPSPNRRTPQRWSSPPHLRPLLRGPPRNSGV